MDTAETPGPNRELARLPETLPALGRTPLTPASRPSTGGGSQLSPRLVMKALARHWWQAMVLWIIGTAALAVLVYFRYEPTYRSESLLRIEPNEATPFGTTGSENLDTFMRTQVQLAQSPNVLSTALLEPSVSSGPTIRSAIDAEQALLEMLDVSVQSQTYLMQIAAESTDPVEAAAVVDAVTQAFLEMDATWAEAQTTEQIKKLELFEQQLQERLDARHEEMIALVSQSDDPTLMYTGLNPSLDGDGSAGAEDASGSDVPKVTIERYAQLEGNLLQLEMAKAEAEANLTAAHDRTLQEDPRQWVEQRVNTEFYSLPQTQAIQQQLNDLNARIDEFQRRIRNPNDPAIVRLKQQRAGLLDEWNRLWREMEPKIREALASHEDSPEQRVRQAEGILAMINRQLEITKKTLKELEVVTKDRGEDQVRASILKADIGELRGMLSSVHKRLEALKFESQGQKRIIQVNDPKPGRKPISDKRTKFLAVTPIAVLAMVMGLVTLVEMRAGRVSGADDLSGRVSAEVFSVPPLPTSRPSNRKKLNAPERDLELERFIQQLDHLRVAICGEGGHTEGLGRCMLITSAVGGEGKTTLAAQLAVRCAEAGAKTVLVDADLRRARLGQLFEIPECPGLSDVLRGDTPLDDALAPIHQVGGCYLLPAGSPEPHPNRILRGKAFGPMIDRLRKSFDAVIIDTSPVLPVPDALILGRFTDGAVLATRHDQSRFPSIDRANHLLTGAGIPVLGVVVNGARSPGASYDDYTYKPERTRGSSASDSSTTDSRMS